MQKINYLISQVVPEAVLATATPLTVVVVLSPFAVAHQDSASFLPLFTLVVETTDTPAVVDVQTHSLSFLQEAKVIATKAIANKVIFFIFIFFKV